MARGWGAASVVVIISAFVAAAHIHTDAGGGRGAAQAGKKTAGRVKPNEVLTDMCSKS
jgi:GH15 family glucan-1,4-alpha-glucosidase